MTSKALHPHTGDFVLSEAQLDEVMTALCINGTSYAVMLASPFDLEDFARGFALSEALVQHADEIRDLVISTTPQGITIDLALSPRATHAAKQRQRSISSTSSCGLCGADAIALALPALSTAIAPDQPTSAAAIRAARAQLPSLQPRNRDSRGGMHAAALFDASGNVIAVREDVGRHNALDKLLGATATLNHRNHFVLLSSRCSYELVLKCARAGVGTLVTLAGPTTLAVQYARERNVALSCFIGDELHRFHVAT